MDGNGMRGKCAGKGGEVRPCYGSESSAKGECKIQGYPERIRFQLRLHSICLFRFLTFRVPCRQKWLISVLNHFFKPSKYSI